MRIARALGVALAAVLLGGCGSGTSPAASPAPTPGSSGSPATPSAPKAMRWVSSYGVEVAVPKAWRFAFGPSLPACVRSRSKAPRAPYVAVGQANLPTLSVLCAAMVQTAAPPRAFGDLHFSFWQPYVELDRADLAVHRPVGGWTFRGWHLRRAHVGPLMITVLAPPGQPGLADRVIGSARRVTTDGLGCALLAPRGPRGALPRPGAVGSVSVCEYDRSVRGRPRLEASTSLTGTAARALVRAIRVAALGGGPDRPRGCLGGHDDPGAASLTLRFVRGRHPALGDTTAVVRTDSCGHNGIEEAAGRHALTPADCRPLFARLPVVLWEAKQDVMEICAGP